MISVSILKEPLVKTLAISLLLHGVVFGVLNSFNYRQSGLSVQEFKSVKIEFQNVAKNLLETEESSSQELPLVEETSPVVVADTLLDTPKMSESLIADNNVQADHELEVVTEELESVPFKPSLQSSTNNNSENIDVSLIPVFSPVEDEYSDIETMTLSDLRIPSPFYPAKAKQMGWEGNVQINFTVNSKGRPDQIEIKKSSGYEILDQAVLDTVKKRWRFSKENAGLKLKKTFSFQLI